MPDALNPPDPTMAVSFLLQAGSSLAPGPTHRLVTFVASPRPLTPRLLPQPAAFTLPSGLAPSVSDRTISAPIVSPASSATVVLGGLADSFAVKLCIAPAYPCIPHSHNRRDYYSREYLPYRFPPLSLPSRLRSSLVGRGFCGCRDHGFVPPA